MQQTHYNVTAVRWLTGACLAIVFSTSSTHAYLEQAGVDHTWIRLEEIGIHGNGHFYFIERNSDQVAGVVLRWLARRVHDRTKGSEAVAAESPRRSRRQSRE